MDTLVSPRGHLPAPAAPVARSSFTSAGTRIPLFTSAPTACIDITDQLRRFVTAAGVRTGTVTVQTLHTTTALVVNEGEPLLLRDFESLLERLVPRAAFYRHDDLAQRPDVAADEPLNGHAHCRALLLPTSVTLTVMGGDLVLGRWQRLFFIELDGPRRRELVAVVTGEGAR